MIPCRPLNTLAIQVHSTTVTAAHLLDEPLAVIDGKQSLVHAVWGGLQVFSLTRQHVRVTLGGVTALSLRLKHGDVRVSHEEREGAMQGTKFLDLVGAPPPRGSLVLHGEGFTEWHIKTGIWALLYCIIHKQREKFCLSKQYLYMYTYGYSRCHYMYIVHVHVFRVREWACTMNYSTNISAIA